MTNEHSNQTVTCLECSHRHEIEGYNCKCGCHEFDCPKCGYHKPIKQLNPDNSNKWICGYCSEAFK